MNLGLLAYFKYCNFFIENFNAVFSKVGLSTLTPWNVILPIGISFYTFESITYAVDVYRKVHKPLNNFLDYQLYIILFPKLIAGPIVRYQEIAEQIKDRSGYENTDNRISGFVRFTIGLSKKVLIANSLGTLADEYYSLHIEAISTFQIWIASLAYTFQIYFDFSGYSDMAIGLGKMIGFRFPENFDNPYNSKSITEFWQRWHITLGRWMKNYLYIPLGGNRTKTKQRLYINLWIVFLASGFWHGASWNFIVWGFLHGLMLVLERMFLLNIYKKIPALFSILITLLIVNFLWIFFRIDNVSTAFQYVFKMLIPSAGQFPNLLPDREQIFYLITAFIFSLACLIPAFKNLQNIIYLEVYSFRSATVLVIISIAFFYLSCAYLTSSTFNPFIYFRF